MSRVRVGVLISGRGSNMKSLIEASKAPDFPAEIVVAVSNIPTAGGLEVAASLGVEPAVIDHRLFGKDREAHERAMDAVLRERGVELVALAGFMRLLTPWFVGQWAGRMINIHPSLLPSFPGLDTHQRALDAGVKLHGCTVHLVTEGVDEGPILGQAAVPVLPSDDAATLAGRVLKAELQLYPACLAALAQNKRAPADADALLINL